MRRVVAAVLLLAVSTLAPAETIYKYRQPDGRTIYSDRVLPNATLLEAFEYRFAPPARPAGDTEASRRQAEERVRAHLAALDKAWTEVQEAHQALVAARERLRAGVEPVEPEPRQLAGPRPAEEGGPGTAAPEAGGPMKPAAPAVGGPQPRAPAAAGGPMGTRHGGGGRSPEYRERMEKLEADAHAAQERFDAALRRYNALR